MKPTGQKDVVDGIPYENDQEQERNPYRNGLRGAAALLGFHNGQGMLAAAEAETIAAELRSVGSRQAEDFPPPNCLVPQVCNGCSR